MNYSPLKIATTSKKAPVQPMTHGRSGPVNSAYTTATRAITLSTTPLTPLPPPPIMQITSPRGRDPRSTRLCLRVLSSSTPRERPVSGTHQTQVHSPRNHSGASCGPSQSLVSIKRNPLPTVLFPKSLRRLSWIVLYRPRPTPRSSPLPTLAAVPPGSQSHITMFRSRPTIVSLHI